MKKPARQPRLAIAEERSITIEDFLATCKEEVFVPLSEEKLRSVTATASDVRFRRYMVNSENLLESMLFVASDTDHDRTRWFTSTDDVPMTARRMITYRELLTLQELLLSYLERLRVDRAGRRSRSSPRAMTLHCSACDARWLLDGNHGFIQVCMSGAHRDMAITEMTSPELGMRGCQC